MRCSFLKYTKYFCKAAPFYGEKTLAANSCRLARPFRCPSTALLRIEFTAPQCSHGASALLPHFFTMTSHKGGYISLLHLSWGHPRQALPVILALWSPDFPHLSAFAAQPRLSDLVAGLLYSKIAPLSNILQNVLIVYILFVGRRLASAVL